MGLEDLLQKGNNKRIKRNYKSSKGNKKIMLSVIFKYNNLKKSYLVNEGYTILEVARKYNIEIEGSCEGSFGVFNLSYFDRRKMV